MANAVGNAIFLFAFLLIVFALSIVFTIGDSLVTNLGTELNATGVGNDTAVMSVVTGYNDIRQTMQYGVYFLTALFVTGMLYSSFVDTHNLFSYFLTFITSVIVTAVASYVLTTFWNTWITTSITQDFLPTWYISNITTLFFLNILAFLASFVFIKKNKV